MKQRKKTGVIFLSESESSLGLSDDSNADPTFRLTSCESSASTECSDSEQYSEETVSTSGPSTPKGNITGSLQPTKKQVSFPRKLVWKIGNLDVPAWYADTVPVPVGDYFMNLDTPFQFFKYFFGDEIFEKILSESQHYAIQKDPNKPLAINKNELKKFVGICIIMSVVHLPNTRSYWNASLGNTIIQETMSCNRFENIRTNLHFSNNEDTVPSGQPGHDRLHKIRPVINHLNAKFASVPMEESLSLDEQLCATKARHYLKQYMPMKPHKWGYKLFILSGVSGFAYKFEVYSGMENDESQRLESEPDLGACANVVVRLGRLIPEKKNHRLYFDNYFTTPGLMVFFEKKGIHCLGTVRQNRLPGVKVPSKKELLKKERGYSSECVTRVEDVDLSCVVWKDNKAVTLMSTFAGENPKCKVSRFDKKKKEIIEVECPNVVSIYNKHMGGVDLLDSIIGRYKIKLRSKKWYMKLFYHFLDLTLVNSWLLYRRVLQEKGIDSNMGLSDFREEVALSLCRMGQSNNKRGRPSQELENALQEKKKKANAAPVPTADIRLDGYCHWPVWMDSRQRCKIPSCKSLSYTKCEKCRVHLCYKKDSNCFKIYHTS